MAIFTTGLAFAMAHEAASGAHAFDATHFATRLIFPGCVMSCFFFRLGPAFILAPHWSARIAIAFILLAAG